MLARVQLPALAALVHNVLVVLVAVAGGPGACAPLPPPAAHNGTANVAGDCRLILHGILVFVAAVSTVCAHWRAALLNVRAVGALCVYESLCVCVK